MILCCNTVSEGRLSREAKDKNAENEITSDNKKMTIRYDGVCYYLIPRHYFSSTRSRVEPNGRLTVENYYRRAIRGTHNDVA